MESAPIDLWISQVCSPRIVELLGASAENFLQALTTLSLNYTWNFLLLA